MGPRQDDVGAREERLRPAGLAQHRGAALEVGAVARGERLAGDAGQTGARARRASASTTGSSAFTTAQSEGCWFAKTRALAAT